MTETETPVMARPKKKPAASPAPARDVAKVNSDVMRDARIVVAYTGEKLSDYLSRILAPIVARDLAAEQQKAKPKSK